MAAPGRQIVVFKMDDLATSWWREWKILTDLVKAEDVKAGLGIFAASLLEGDTAYDAWIADLLADGRFELWNHGFTGSGPNGEPGREHQGTPYAYQKASFDQSRNALLTRCDRIMRTFAEHWYGGDATTVKVVSEDPSLRVWMAWESEHLAAAAAAIPADLRVLGSLPVSMECPDPKNWTPGYVNCSEFEKEYRGHEADAYLVLQGHPWSWTETSAKPDRTGAVLDRWNEFRKIVRFLKTRDALFMNPYEYYRHVRGFAADTTPPAAPSGLSVTRSGANAVTLAWMAPAAPASGLDCYKIYRNGRPVGLSTTAAWSSALLDLAPADTFQVAAVSRAELTSARTPSARAA